MRHFLGWGFFAVAGGLGLTACNLVANLGQFDNATNAPDDAATLGPDVATSPPSDATTPLDAGADAASTGDNEEPVTPGSDAGGATDAASATETGTGNPDAAAPRWCLTHTSGTTSYCRDFDDGTSYLTGWSGTYFTPHDLASLDSTDFAPGSGPNSLLITTPSLDGGAAQELFTEYVNFHNVIDLKFALKIESFDQNAADVSMVRVAYQNSAWWVSLDFNNTAGQILETFSAQPDGSTMQSYISHPIPAQPPLGAWTNVELLVDSTGNTATLYYEGALIVSVPLSNPPTTSAFSVQVGLNYLQEPAQPMQFSYDNILIDTP